MSMKRIKRKKPKPRGEPVDLTPIVARQWQRHREIDEIIVNAWRPEWQRKAMGLKVVEFAK